MYKKYAVRELQAKEYNNGKAYRSYILKADVFGKSMEYNVEPDWFERNAVKPNYKVAQMLKRLTKGLKYKETPFLENVVEIARHIK